MNKLTLHVVVALAVVALTACAAVPAQAHMILVEYQDGPQDPLAVPEQMHELGDNPPFPPDEEILSQTLDETNETACFDGSDDPAFPNALVSITNNTPTTWYNVHYVADPETGITNFDGWIGNLGAGDAEEAFRIDSVGINRPLVSESITANDIFEPGETWEFIIQDFTNAAGGPPTPFDSLGIAGASAGWPPSTGSIIGQVPEPSTFVALAGLLGMGLIGYWRRRRTLKRA
jgi:hypothetical protein